MPMTKAELKRRAAIRTSRSELVKMMHSAKRFRKYFKAVGLAGRVDPGFPQNFPSAPCGPIGKKPPGPPQPITPKRFDAAMREIEILVSNAHRAFNKMYPPPGARR